MGDEAGSGRLRARVHFMARRASLSALQPGGWRLLSIVGWTAPHVCSTSHEGDPRIGPRSEREEGPGEVSDDLKGRAAELTAQIVAARVGAAAGRPNATEGSDLADYIRIVQREMLSALSGEPPSDED